MKNIEKYFLEELNKLDELSKEFVKKHPSLANMVSSSSTDPDVERLLEGVAFLNAFIQREIDDGFVQIAKYILDFALPNILKPFPASTILQIKPNQYLQEKMRLKKGTYFLANVENEEFKFQNIWQMEIYPLEYEIKTAKNKLIFKINSSETIKKIPFFLNLSIDKKVVLFRYFYDAKKIYIKTDSYTKEINLNFLGLEKNVYEFNKTYNPFILLEEYFNFIDKFFLFEIEINENECEVVFEFTKDLPFDITKNDILFYCTPILNVFEYDLDPIELDYKKECIILEDYTKYKIYDVKDIIGHRSNTKVIYHKFNGVQEFEHTYEIYEKMVLDEEKKCLLIHFNSTEVEKEILSVKILATNSNTEILKKDYIKEASDNTPELISFSNITSVTPEVPKVKKENIWDFISYLNISLTRIKTAKDFQKILKLFINQNSKDKNKIYKNIKKVESIEKFDVKLVNKLYKGQLIQGMEVNLEINGEYFINIDEVFLFGVVIEYFLASYVHINNFIVLKIKEKMSGNELVCKEITGNKKLI